jgi:4-diphosphocytidyl-2-C-methyl-D-erythritol kinase
MEAQLSRDWPAPAKLNLFLHITGRRDDGYHLLQTAFQFIDIVDRLDFRLRDDGYVVRLPVLGEGAGDMAAVSEHDDLTLRAALALQAYSGTSHGADIALTKTIPMGGGLGGGSSDAATTLVALNQLWGLALDVDTLCGLALELGADVPVFVRGHAAWAEGVGEQLLAMDPPEPWYLIIYPSCHVPTAEVFAAPELTRNTPPITMHDFLRWGGRNDCLAVVRQRYPAVGAALDWLAEYGVASLTGTGACVFAPFQTRTAALSVLAEVPADWQASVGKGLNSSPLLDRVSAGA